MAPFGRIALTLPSSPTRTDNDGFLDLDELRVLNLSGCELTVLNACRTNIGGILKRQYQGRGDNTSKLPAARVAQRTPLSSGIRQSILLESLHLDWAGRTNELKVAIGQVVVSLSIVRMHVS